MGFFTRKCAKVFVTALLLLMCAFAVRGEAYYGVTANGIFKVDVNTGTYSGGTYATVVNFASAISFAATLATRQSDGMLFYLDSSAANPNLWRYDPSTPGTPPVLVGTTGIGTANVVRLAFDSAGTLYAMDTNSTFLYTLNPATGAVITQTPTSGPGLPTPAGGDICLHPISGVLYMVAGTQLYTVTTTGVITPVGGGTGTISGLPGSMTGCAFDNAGNLVSSPSATLYRINIGSLTAVAMSANTGTAWGDLATIAPGGRSDLSVTKTASNITPGNTVTFTIQVTNSGPARALGVQVTDLLPAGLTFVSRTISTGTYTVATGLWDINALNSGATATLTITANVTTVGAKTNTAQVTFVDNFDPDSTPNNNLASEDDQASVTVTPSPDLQLTKTTATGFAVGAVGSYSISVNNSLGSNATVGSYTVSDTLPPGMTLAAPLPSGSGWSCTGAIGDLSFTCASSSVIAVGGSNPNPITVSVLAAAAAAPTTTNTATISGGGEPASNTGNNSSSVTHAVCSSNCPDLRVSKTSPASFSVGVNSTYSISVNNTLGGIATTAPYIVTDTLPTGITLVAPLPTGTGWTCSGAVVGGSSFSCTNNTTINTGAANPNPITVNVAVANTAVPSVTNTANVSGGGEPTATQGNNAGSVVTPVLGFNLRVVKAGPASFSVGGTGTYTLTVNNTAGTLPTSGTYTVTDTLPAGLTLSAAASGSGWTCQSTGAFAAGGNQISCSRATVIAAGATNTNVITVNVNVGAAAAPSVTNTATVSNPNEPPANTTDNTSAITTPVLAPDLIVTKGHAGDFSVGTLESYTITAHNIGGQATTGTITITDTLPTGITFNSFTGTGWACSVTAAGPPQVVTCTSATAIAANSSGNPIALTVNVLAAAATASPITNNVAVSGGGEPAGNAGNNTDSDVANVYNAPVLAKSFSPSTITSGATSQLTLTISNPVASSVSLLGVAVTDPFPAGMTVAATPGFSNTCGGTVSTGTTQGDTQIVLSGGGPVAPGANCQIQVNVTRATVGTVTNTTGAVSSTNSGIGNTASANLTVTAPTNVTLTKLSSPDPVGAGAPALLTFTITNTAGNPSRSGMAFTDLFPTNVVLFDTTTTNSCGGTLTDSAGAALNAGDLGVRLTGGTMASGTASCQITVRVKSDTPGSYLNDNTRISGLGGSVVANVNDTLNVRGTTLTKAFNPTNIAPGGTSTLTFTISNGAGNPAQTGLSFTDTLPAGVMVVGPVTALQCDGTVSSSGASNISFGGGSMALGASSCSVTVNVTALLSGIYTNGPSNLTGLSAGMNNSANATLTVGAAGSVSGVVYSDANHNADRDGAEAGTGQSLFAKLVPTGSPGGPAIQFATVDSVTGAYNFSGVSAGSYFIVIDNVNSLSDVTPTLPVGWLGTEIPNQIRNGVLVAAIAVPNQDFGLFNGSKLSGVVFEDDSTSVGNANNGLQNGGEPGIAGASVAAIHSSCPGTVCDTTLTDASGNYSLWLPAGIGNTVVSIVETNASSYLSTGAQVGTTLGTYNRASDTVSFTNSIGTSYTGVNFGDVRPNTFDTDGSQTGMPGSTVNYAHSFTANTTGAVTFTTSNIATPSIAGWNNTIYRDSNCNGVLDGAEGAAIFSSTSANAGQIICIIVKEFIPASAPNGAQDTITVTAMFAYANASPILSVSLMRTDTTTAGAAGSAGLTLVKAVDKITALPNEVLTYTITYANSGSSPITSVVINDSTPAFTTYVGGSAGCPNLVVRTNCTVATEPANGATGSVIWSITGNVTPGSSATVRYQVRVQP